MSPFNAFQFIQGIETLPLRIERQSQNASKVSSFLKFIPTSLHNFLEILRLFLTFISY